jgi:hypothetical protein
MDHLSWLCWSSESCTHVCSAVFAGDRRLLREDGTEARTGSAAMKQVRSCSSRAGQGDSRQVTPVANKLDGQAKVDALLTLTDTTMLANCSVSRQ